jgi:aryl-alcohol dehydrogenase-like predicted oxidoreductase
MDRHRLGAAGPEVSALGLGCASFSGYYGAADPVTLADAKQVIGRALDGGIILLDTAAMYGRSEELVGEAIKGHRRGLVIATKFGVQVDANGRPAGTDASPKAIVRSCDESLRKLGIDIIDIYYLHRLDRKVPIEETVGAMADLVSAAKVRHLGLCEVSPRTLRRAHAIHPIAALQSEYSLWSREVEREILPACRALGIGFVAYSPLGRGFLTGRIESADALAPDDARRAIPRFQGDHFAHNRALLEHLRHMAGRYGVTPARCALAWVIAQGEDIVPIPGTRHVAHLDENIEATRLKLTSEDERALTAAFAPERVSGARYGQVAAEFLDSGVK